MQESWGESDFPISIRKGVIIMHKKFFCLIISSIIFSCISFCAEPKNYFPLGKGAQWNYTVKVTAKGNTTGKVIMRVEGTEIISGKTYVKIKTIYSNNLGQINYESYYRKEGKKDELFVYYIDGRLQSKIEQLYMEIPSDLSVDPNLSIGSMFVSFGWKIKQKVGQYVENFDRYRKKTENLEILSEKGSLIEYKDCLIIETKAQSYSSRIQTTEYYAPNVGLVREIGPGISITLDSYKKGGAEPKVNILTSSNDSSFSKEAISSSSEIVKTPDQPQSQQPDIIYSEADLINSLKKSQYIITGGKNYTIRWITVPNRKDLVTILEYLDDAYNALNTSKLIAQSLSNIYAEQIIVMCQGYLERDKESYKKGQGGIDGLRDSYRALKAYLKGK